MFLIETIVTEANSHTTEYLQELAQQAFHRYVDMYKFCVAGFVTDNAAIVTKMRTQLQTTGNLNQTFFYGCCALLLNLLAPGFEILITDETLTIIINLIFSHKPPGWVRQANIHQKKLPTDVRWNSTCETLDSYNKACPSLVTRDEEHREDFKPDINRMVTDFALGKYVEDCLQVLTPIAKALDFVQKSGKIFIRCCFCLAPNGIHSHYIFALCKTSQIRQGIKTLLLPPSICLATIWTLRYFDQIY